MSSYLGTVLVTTPLVGTPLLSAILYFSGESQSDNEKWADQIAEFESFENLCEDGYNWNEENQSCEELSFLEKSEHFFRESSTTFRKNVDDLLLWAFNDQNNVMEEVDEKSCETGFLWNDENEDCQKIQSNPEHFFIRVSDNYRKVATVLLDFTGMKDFLCSDDTCSNLDGTLLFLIHILTMKIFTYSIMYYKESCRSKFSENRIG